MKAKVSIICFLFIGLTGFAGPCIFSSDITCAERILRHSIKVDKGDKNFFFHRTQNGLKPTTASGNSTDILIQRLYNRQYFVHSPAEVANIVKGTATGRTIFPGCIHDRMAMVFNDGIFRNRPVIVAEIFQKN